MLSEQLQCGLADQLHLSVFAWGSALKTSSMASTTLPHMLSANQRCELRLTATRTSRARSGNFCSALPAAELTMVPESEQILPV